MVMRGMKLRLFLSCCALTCALASVVRAEYGFADAPYLEGAVSSGQVEKVTAAAPREIAAARDAFAAVERRLRDDFGDMPADSFHRDRIEKRLEMAKRLCSFAELQARRGDPSSIGFVISALGDLRVFKDYFGQEFEAWKDYPLAPRARPVVLNVKDFGAVGDGRTGDTDAFARAVEAVRTLDGRPSILRIPAGTYLMDGKMPFPCTQYRDVRNGQTFSVPTGEGGHLVLFGLRNCVVTGDGAATTRLVFTVFGLPGVRFSNSVNSSLRNVELMWRDTPFAQGEVLETCPGEGWLVMRHEPGTMRPDDARFGARGSRQVCGLFDESRVAVRIPGLFYDLRSDDLEDGRFKVWFDTKRPGDGCRRSLECARRGHKIVIPYRVGGPAVAMAWCMLCNLDGVWVRNSPGAAVSAVSSYMATGWRCRLFPANERLALSSNADAFYNSRGTYLAECEFSNMNDDAGNSFTRGVDVEAVLPGENAIVHARVLGRLAPGDIVQLLRPHAGRYVAILHVSKTESCRHGDRDLVKTTFAEELPHDVVSSESLGKGTVSAEEWNKINLGLSRPASLPDQLHVPQAFGVGYVVARNRFDSLRNVAVQVQCPNALVESNRISNVNGGVCVSLLAQWHEGPSSYNVLMRGNEISDVDCAFDVSCSSPGRNAPRAAVHRGVEIVGNRFVRAAGVHISCAEDVKVADNLFDGRPRVSIGPVAGLSMTGNQMGGEKAGERIFSDMLVVGGDEAACAAAIQAARLGVPRIALVSDCAMLGGQFSAQGVGPVDERVKVDGESVNFPRSGLALEVIDAIRAYNLSKYGRASPGNCWSATETIEPRPAAEIFERLLAPYAENGTGQMAIWRDRVPVRVLKEDGRICGVVFSGGLEVRARIVVDASDWGDVIRLGEVRHMSGSDEKPQEMNPITWTVTLRETGRFRPIPKPRGYEKARYPRGDIWAESGIFRCPYPPGVPATPYAQRRLLDRRHYGLDAMETIQLNTTCQDYPLCDLPPEVAAALEAVSPGASRKNIVEMSPEERAILFDDAKRHTLGYLYFLQHDNPATTNRMGRFEILDDYDTPDGLPPKPYVREGLRLAALHVLREDEVKASDPERPGWAKCPYDAAFGFQFHIDFHPTRRIFPDPSNSNVWRCVHTPERGWSSATERAFFPLRGFVPETAEGLLGAGKNIGVSSPVQAALRLHPQMLLSGQCAATLAARALATGCSPREIVGDRAAVAEIQETLVRGVGGKPGIAIWVWQDLCPDDPDFVRANLPVVRPAPVSSQGFRWRARNPRR